MDETTRWMNRELQKIEEEQMAYSGLLKKFEMVEDEMLQGNISSYRELEETREFWYHDSRLHNCLESIQMKQHAIQNELRRVQEEREDELKKLERSWRDREEEIRWEYKKKVGALNE